MKSPVLLSLLFANVWFVQAQDESRFKFSIEPSIGVSIQMLNYRALAPNSYTKYQKEKMAPAFGLKFSINDLKKHVGIDLSVASIPKITHGIEYTYATLQPDPNIPEKETAEFSEVRLSIAPYYDFLKSNRFKLALGLILNISTNKFISEYTTMQTGPNRPHSGYADEFNSGRKISYGPYLTAGLSERHLNANLFASYNLHSEKYLNTTETKPGRSILVGFSVGYILPL